MRDNESDGEGGWEQPPEYVSPWAPREEGPGEAPPAQDRYQDTVAFGMPPASSGPASSGPASSGPASSGPASSGRADQGSYGQAWYGNQPGYGGQPGYGSQGGYGGQGGYGSQGGYGTADWPGGYGNQPGYGQDRYQAEGGYQAQGGSGGPGGGWAPPDPPAGRGSRGGRFLVYLGVAALAAGIGAGVTVAVDSHGPAPAAGISSSDVPAPHNNAAGSGSSSAPLDPAAVVKKVDPGLVDIVSTLKYKNETAEGTGMIISSSGLVLTNNHVIDGATTIRVTLVHPHNGTSASYAARVVGYDATDDVALLKLQGASGLPAVIFGNSSQVTLGTPVLALGNAEGRGGAKPAQGIINALNRSIQASDEGSNSTENLNHMLQTNARIQEGDSGGALANNAGQVIGMITAANTPNSGQLAPSGGTLGFAIPINSALAVAKQIVSGRPTATVYIGLPGFLGVEVAASSSPSPQQQAADEARGSGGAGARTGSSCQTTNTPTGVPSRFAPVAAGALVLGLLCDTAATSAGMVPGDVITSVDGQPITTPDSLTGVTAKYHPGQVVSVLWVSLDGVEHTTRMQLGPGPAR